MAQKKKKQQPKPMSHSKATRKYFLEKVRSLPVDKCLIASEDGLSVCIITRRMPSGQFAYASFLVDTDCLGVKDAFYDYRVTDETVEELIDAYDLDFEEVDYIYFHNFVLGAVAYAEELDIEPAREFEIAEYILDEDSDDIPLMEFEYGRDGKPCLQIGPDGKERKYLGVLYDKLGSDGFTVFDASYDNDEYGEYDDDEEYGEYPDEEPGDDCGDSCAHDLFRQMVELMDDEEADEEAK